MLDDKILAKYGLAKLVGNLTNDTMVEPIPNKRCYESVANKVHRAENDGAKHDYLKPELISKPAESDAVDNVIDVAWKGVKVLESSDSDSSDSSSSHGFDYDSKYLVEIRGLPTSATRQEVRNLFGGISILNGLNGIHFVFDEKYRKHGLAFVQFEHMRDYQSVYNYNTPRLNGQHIEGNLTHFLRIVQFFKCFVFDILIVWPKNGFRSVQSLFKHTHN